MAFHIHRNLRERVTEDSLARVLDPRNRACLLCVNFSGLDRHSWAEQHTDDDVRVDNAPLNIRGTRKGIIQLCLLGKQRVPQGEQTHKRVH